MEVSVCFCYIFIGFIIFTNGSLLSMDLKVITDENIYLRDFVVLSHSSSVLNVN